ncbi:MAG: hypothetical protein CMI96_01235 [Pelagibacteraceae bacterium]|nr:hypothetical protein [Pelagibacteraceae bacterium]|tara:strand:+ start:3653 stop:4573 length:921 start_codon:yes stop_codon:yes gene_type:complete
MKLFNIYIPTSLKKSLRNIRSYHRRLHYNANLFLGKYSTIENEEFVHCIRSLGVNQGDSVLVHSSLSRLGHINGGGEMVLNSLTNILGESGNLCLPAFTTIGNSKEYLQSGVIFDPKVTLPTTGRLSNLFLKRENVVRSIHPTHSVIAYGKDSESIIDGHDNCVKPFGYGSPFEKLLNINSWLLFIGVDIRCLTMYHTFEDLSENFPFNPYIKNPIKVDVINNDGKKKLMKTYVHDPDKSRYRLEVHKGVRNKIKEYFNSSGVLKTRKLGDGYVYAMRSKEWFRVMTNMLSEGITIYADYCKGIKI